MSASRPKPWEVSSGTSSAVASGQTPEIPPQLHQHTAAPSVSSPEPVLPERPTSLSNGISSSSSYPYDSTSGLGSGGLSGYGSSMYGSGMYGSGMGGLGGLGGYSRYGSGMGGMYGGYGGMHGGYGGGMYGGGMYGNNGSYGQSGEGGFAESTQATFQLIESIIGAFGGFAQMLEATYMATHSSFFTMISVAEQFGHLKSALGSFLGIFALIKYVKKILAKITGKNMNYLKIDAKEFAKFEAKSNNGSAPDKPARKRLSLKPLLIFLAMVIGTPYLLKKLVFYLAKQRNIPLPNQFAQPGLTQGHGGQPQEQMDISKIEFGRALYDFVPENEQVELGLKTGDLVAILSKLDPMGRESKWWRVRSRDGKSGYIPGNYVEIIQRKERQNSIENNV